MSQFDFLNPQWTILAESPAKSRGNSRMHQGKESRLGPINGSGNSGIGWVGTLRENAADLRERNK
jgi:hypothetical protein